VRCRRDQGRRRGVRRRQHLVSRRRASRRCAVTVFATRCATRQCRRRQRHEARRVRQTTASSSRPSASSACGCSSYPTPIATANAVGGPSQPRAIVVPGQHRYGHQRRLRLRALHVQRRSCGRDGGGSRWATSRALRPATPRPTTEPRTSTGGTARRFVDRRDPARLARSSRHVRGQPDQRDGALEPHHVASAVGSRALAGLEREDHHAHRRLERPHPPAAAASPRGARGRRAPAGHAAELRHRRRHERHAHRADVRQHLGVVDGHPRLLRYRSFRAAPMRATRITRPPTGSSTSSSRAATWTGLNVTAIKPTQPDQIDPMAPVAGAGGAVHAGLRRDHEACHVVQRTRTAPWWRFRPA